MQSAAGKKPPPHPSRRRRDALRSLPSTKQRLSPTADVAALQRSLDAERRRLAAIVAVTGAGTWKWNVQTDDALFDERWAQLLGYSAAELEPHSGQTGIALIHPDDCDRVKDVLTAHLCGREPYYSAEMRMRHRNGSWVWLRDHGVVTAWTDDGRPLWMSGMHEDITLQKAEDEALRESRELLDRTDRPAGTGGWDDHRPTAELAEQHELLRVTLQSISDAVITTDADGAVRWLNPVAQRLTGWSTDEAHGRSLSTVFVTVNDGDSTAPADHSVLIARGGQQLGIESSIAPIRNDHGDLLGDVVVFRDVTEQRRLTNEMRYRASHDSLTGLINRPEFEFRLQRLLETAHDGRSSAALLYVDLDRFKIINDTCGHCVGDDALRAVTKLIGNAVRTRNTLARLGGDEFAIILEHCAIDEAQLIAQHVCDRLDEFRYVHAGRRFHIGASIGVVPIDQGCTTAASLIAAADAACYAAKRGGGNRVHTWRQGERAPRARRDEMHAAARIDRALAAQPFSLFAQRIEPLRGGASGLHAEVLLRLIDANGSLLAPAACLSAAERSQLFARIDRWVVIQAVAALKALPARHAFTMLHVNVCAQSIGDRAFHDWMRTTLRDAGPVICSRLCFELPQIAANSNLREVMRFIELVRAAGVRIALDAFGSGSVSYGYLNTLEFDCLKIDGEVMRGLTDDPLCEVAVRACADVARIVGGTTVAGHVDRPELIERLTELGIDFVQGFAIHQPAPLVDLLDIGLAIAE